MSSRQPEGSGGGRGGWREQLSAIGKLIVESQGMDEDGKEMCAYQSYLASVQYIAQTLAADIMTNQARGSLPSPQAAKLFKMAKHCLERAEEMYETAQGEGRGLAGEEAAGFGTASQTPAQPAVSVTQQQPSPQQQATPTPQSYQQQYQQQQQCPVPRQQRGATFSATSSQAPSSTNTLPIPTSATLPPPTSVGRAHSFPSNSTTTIPRTDKALSSLHNVGTSYMKEARLRNQYMMEQYKAHLRHTSSQILPHSQEMGLSMLRRLEENVSVARIRQQNLARKARERELRKQQAETKTASKRQQVISLSKLSVEELKEQVASFEHGKSFLTTLKNKLVSIAPNTPGSSSSLTSTSTTSPSPTTATEVYNFVNEILSNQDHPLSRLLGEYQMEVFSLLKPMHSAVERAGGLPRLHIRLKNEGEQGQPALPRRPRCASSPEPLTSHSPTLNTTSPHPPAITVETEEGSSHLDLFYLDNDREDDDLFALSTNESHLETLSSTNSESNPVSPPGGVKFSNGSPGLGISAGAHGSGEGRDRMEETGGGGGGGGGEGMDDKLERLRSELMREVRERENSSNSEGGGRSGEDTRERQEPRSKGEEGREAEEDSMAQNFGVEGSAPLSQTDGSQEAPQNGDSCTAGPRRNHLYANAEDIANFLRSRGERDSQPVKVFSHDLPDGGMFSRPPPPPEIEEEEEEEEEEVVFSSLPLLTCQAHVGNEEKMRELEESAVSALAQVVPMIHTSLRKLEKVFIVCYPSLSPYQQREECRSVLESQFFPAITQPLLSLYRCKNYSEEVATALNMCSNCNTTPKDLDVRRKFWLLEQAHAPYGEAIDELRRVPSLHYPTLKLNCLVRTSRQVVQCIDDYYEAQGQPKGSVDSGVGVDDILPILSYVIIRSGLPQLVSETAVMEEFIQDGYVKGEEGFCLTSFMTALKFVSQMSS